MQKATMQLDKWYKVKIPSSERESYFNGKIEVKKTAYNIYEFRKLTKDGKYRNVRRYITKANRLSICMEYKGVTMQAMVGILLAKMFLPMPEYASSIKKKGIVCYKNGNTLDNDLTNLQWKRWGDHFVTLPSKCRKLTHESIYKIRELYSEGSMQKDIAKAIGVSNQTISYVLSGRTWSQAVTPFDEKCNRRFWCYDSGND